MTVQIETNKPVKKQADNIPLGHLKTVVLRTYRNEKKQQQADEQKKIVELLPMVSKLARKVVKYINPPLTFEDMVAAGTVGLVKAAKNYNPCRQADFKTYAYIRIRGAILDELKKWSFVPAQMGKKIAAAQKAAKDIKQKTGAEPTDEAISQHLKIPLEQLYKIYNSQRARLFLSIDSSQPDSIPLASSLYAYNAETPERKIEKSELIDVLTKAIQQLSAKKRQTIILYYQKNLTMKQIAEVLEITESRVSQLHAAALFSLSCKLKDFRNA